MHVLQLTRSNRTRRAHNQCTHNNIPSIRTVPFQPAITNTYTRTANQKHVAARTEQTPNSDM